MKKARNFIIFLCLCSSLLAVENADEASGKIYYHWITKNKLYLWKDADREPVTVVKDIEEWKLPAVEIISNQDWAALVKGAVSPEYIKDISTNEDLWMAFLNYIYEQKPDDQKIKLKYPDVSLYFHLSSEHSGEMTYMFQKEIYSFYFSFNKNNKKWEKKGNISLVTMLGIKGEAELKKIFERDIAGSEKKEYDFWDAWIKYFTSITEPYSYFYENAEKKGQWLLIEKIESTNFTERMRPQPPKPEIVTKTETIEAEPKVITQTIPFYIILIICAIVFLTNPLSTFLFKFFRLRKMGSLSTENYQETLESMERKDKSLIDEVNSLIARIKGMQKKRENLIEVSINKIREIKDNEVFVKLGNSAYQYYKNSKKEGGGLEEGQWIKYQFNNLKDLKKKLTDKEVELKNLKEKIESTRKENEKIFDELGKIEGVKGEQLIERWNSLNKLLEEEKVFHVKAKKDLDAKEKQLMDIKTDMGNIFKSITPLENGLHKALGNSKDKDTNITAMISFLVFHSLFHFSHAVVNGEEKKKKAMFSNLFRISEKLKVKKAYAVFQNVELKEFGVFFNQIREDFPGITEEKIEVSEKEPKNAEFFQDLLKRLRDLSDSQLDFGPYYYGIDESKKAYRAM